MAIFESNSKPWDGQFSRKDAKLAKKFQFFYVLFLRLNTPFGFKPLRPCVFARDAPFLTWFALIFTISDQSELCAKKPYPEAIRQKGFHNY